MLRCRADGNVLAAGAARWSTGSTLLGRRIGQVQPDVEGRGIALGRRRDREHELVAAALVDAVPGIRGVGLSLGSIRLLRVNLLRKLVVKENCDVNSYAWPSAASVRTLKWMWTARPLYQPG